MSTQEERIITLEQTFAIFRREASARTQEIEENTTIMLGVMRAQGQDIRRIFERVEIIDQRLSRLETKFDEHTLKLNNLETLLTQILARLPENPPQK